MKRRLTGGEEETAGGGGDETCKLPDEIIHRILYMLDTPKEATRTSVLSRRWLRLWRSYPVVEFYHSQVVWSHDKALINAHFRSFAAAASRRMLSTDSALDAFCISMPAIQNEDLDRLLTLLASADRLSPVHFVLRMGGSDCYGVSCLNWSRTKYVMLQSCELEPTTMCKVSMGSLKVVHFRNVCLSEQVIQSLLGNAPCLESLTLNYIFGIDRLDVVTSPQLQSLSLDRILGHARYGECTSFRAMSRLRISCPKLQSLEMGIVDPMTLDELEIDAPSLVTLTWTVSFDHPMANVNVVNLAPTCQSLLKSRSACEGFTTPWVGQFFSTTLAKLHRPFLDFNMLFRSSPQQQVTMDLFQAEWAFRPLTVRQVRFAEYTMRGIEDVAAVLDYFFRFFHPKCVLISQIRERCMMVEYMCSKFLKRDASSWRHNLIDMKIKDGTTGEMMEVSEDMNPSLAMQDTVYFMLTWC